MEDKTIPKRTERDLSPSAFSQSSVGLEWDPSADVGTSENLPDDPCARTSRSQMEFRRPEHKSESEVSSLGASVPTHDDASIRTRMTRSEIEYETRRAKNKSDSELATAGLSVTKHGDSFAFTGMTRSEIEYQKKKTKNKSSSETSSAEASTSVTRDTLGSSEMQYKKLQSKDKTDSEGSSVIWVEVQQTLNPRNRQLKDVGIQTSNVLEHTSELFESTTFSDAYHSTPTDRFRSRARGRENKVSSEGDRDVDQMSTAKERRRERSPPQPFAVASRKSSHRHHDAHHSRLNGRNCISDHRLSESEKQTSGSSGLSASCFLIDKLMKTENRPGKNEDISTLQAYEKHRDYHVTKVKQELKKLDKLNQLLSSRLKGAVEYHSSNSLGTKQVVTTKCDSSIGTIPKRTSPSKTKSDSKAKTSRPRTLTSCSSTNISSSSSSRGTYTVSGPSSNSHAASSVQAVKSQMEILKETKVLLNEKMTELAGTFTTVMERIEAATKNIPVTNNQIKAPNKKKTRPQEKPVQPPVAYYINFSASNDEFIIETVEQEVSVVKENPPSVAELFRSSKVFQSSKSATAESSSTVSEEDDDEENIDPDMNSDEEGVLQEANKEDFYVQKVQGKPLRSTLQNAFQQRNPTFISRVQCREAVLLRLKAERELRAQKKREWIRKYGEDPRAGFNGLENALPPKGPRLMTTKEMKDLTDKKYKNLPEVRGKILQKKAEDEKRTNRLMSQVFASKLRQEVLKGEMNIVHNRSLIRR